MAQHHPTTSSTLCRMPHLNNKNTTKQKYKPNHQQTGLPPHSTLPIRGKTNKHSSAQISLYTKLAQTTRPNLGGQKPKGRKNSTLKPDKRDLKHNNLNNEKAEKYYTNEGTG